ncbi:MAG: hypothetical protein PHE54_03385 [Bacilli bacterium]|nr:hypothetical protein [Bacilli bacterium]
MTSLKKYRGLIIILTCILILLLVFVFAIDSLVTDGSETVYGTRLEGIEAVAITGDRLVVISTKLKDNDNVVDANTYITGRIVKIIIEVNSDVTYVTSKSIIENIMTMFSEDEQAYYDFEAYVTCHDEEDELYPIIGYKHKTSLNFNWTNNS